MASHGYPSHSYAPSAPPMPTTSSSFATDVGSGGLGVNSVPAGATNYSTAPPGTVANYAPPPYVYAPPSFHGVGYFPPGTHPEIIRSFQAVDRDRSGFIDEFELQGALSSGYQKFSHRTIRLLIFLFGNPMNPSKIGPAEFAALWNSLGQWRAIFERFDRNLSGEIDSSELTNALLSLGCVVPPSVIQVLMSKYNDGKGDRGALNFDSFVECGMLVKGLTEKFKEKDPRLTGSATVSYDDFMLMVIPFLVA